MWKRSFPQLFSSSFKLLSGGVPKVPPTPDRDDPAMPWRVGDENKDITQSYKKDSLFSKLLDTGIPMKEELIRGRARWEWQEPAKFHYNTVSDETIALEEHDMEEFNEQPYITVNHLYEPPLGSQDNPIRLEAQGLPGDNVSVKCMGNCAPHVPQGAYDISMKGYKNNQCPMCRQFFYVHNRPLLVMNPDWTEDPASDDGPAFKFAEIESEFDRDFHEFSMYLSTE
ncbi:hypothetical protein XU18_3494 [Perkinsela sp. CCAP 1560/4]|nr:hypothetical protein XU18_3494 [Perkinsela sp. CCAP 1560/4]|eukprot:KNH05523.1 hypothetical protein XU18_3494 [Perkinsela sp. CCAP 1560/4]